MAEWSKAVDLRPTIVRCEGSNPSSCNERGHVQQINLFLYHMRSRYIRFFKNSDMV
jgi:hypothetical protein